MIFNQFGTMLAVRTALLLLALMALSYALVAKGYYGLTLLLTLITIGLVIEMYRFVARTNMEVVRFLDAARFEDFGQRIAVPSSGAGFEQLAGAFEEMFERFKASRQDKEQLHKHLLALTEQVPVPLFSVNTDNSVMLHNNAARKLFSGTRVTRVENLSVFGDELATAISSLEPGRNRLINFVKDGSTRQLVAKCSEVVTANGEELLISLQDIQSELDEVQSQAWHELVSVLTHEIMNSITPVASLAQTTAELIRDVDYPASENQRLSNQLDDAFNAAETVARRSQGLIRFVESYRSLTCLSVPNKQSVGLADLVDKVVELLSADPQQETPIFETRIEPKDLQLHADPHQLEQLLINLIKNAYDAVSEINAPEIRLTAEVTSTGSTRVVIEDNGAGIPEQLLEKVFVPFFTSKRQGTGVGLALARQIMTAHGGSIQAGRSTLGGAIITLLF